MGKCQHVCGPLAIHELAVVGRHLIRVDENQRHLGVCGQALECEDDLGEVAQRVPVDRMILLVAKENVHAGCVLRGVGNPGYGILVW